MSKQKNKAARRLLITAWCVGGIFLFLSAVVLGTTEKYAQYFGIPFESFLFTIRSSTAGADVGFVGDIAWELAPSLTGLAFLLVLVGWMLFQNKVCVALELGSQSRKIRLLPHWFLAPAMLVCGIGMTLYSVQHMDQVVGISEYFALLDDSTAIYEDYYVDPQAVQISQPEKKKNLLYIYMESMETTYAAAADGGAQPVSYIPGATQLARENISFSNTDQLGGFVAMPGATWTMGALFATQTGLPFAFPVEGNSMGELDVFAANVTGLGDLLEEYGYQQMFLCGSDVKFAGRDHFFRDHGDFQLYDYYTALENGDIPEDYHVWWGFDDRYLYEIAQKELLQLSQGGQPFNLTMLTVDPHHVGGYICPLCEESYGVKAANVVSCADRQLMAFLSWLEQQDFYEDTVVVIAGDHPRMDTQLVDGVAYNDRTLYNCFLNVEPAEGFQKNNRDFCSADMYPTVLEALGYRIEGGRLGLGTSLFSDRKTLMEELTTDYLFQELSKKSKFYMENFV